MHVRSHTHFISLPFIILLSPCTITFSVENGMFFENGYPLQDTVYLERETDSVFPESEIDSRYPGFVDTPPIPLLR